LIRTTDDRMADVRRLLAAARAVHADRARLAGRIAASTGLTPQGVELGFASLELDATDDELRALVAAAGDAPHVHVVLSANVFVAPLRALALARAAAPVVTVRPSPRDPVLTEALVAAAGDRSLVLVEDRDVAHAGAGEVHVYGRDRTIAEVRAQVRSGVRVRGHGAGMGVAVVSDAVDLAQAAGAVAFDVAAFDQRGCLSPRVAFVVGDETRAAAFAQATHEALAAFGERVPRGSLSDDERSEAARWRDLAAFAGGLRAAEDHAVALFPGLDAAALPPPGRHLVVVAIPTVAALEATLRPMAPYVVAVGSDDPRAPAPAHARRSSLGAMQRPPLDGPVDRRSA
jgi:hypothetical protein